MTESSDKHQPAETPWVRLRSARLQTFIYQKMVGDVAKNANPGDIVRVLDRNDVVFGHAIYNPRSRITLRMLNYDATPIDDAFWRNAITRAVSLRRETLRLDETTDTYRVIHAEGDGISGLIVDRYGDVLSVEVFSRGIWNRIESLLPILHELTGTKHHRVSVDERVLQQEGFNAKPIVSPDLPKGVNVTENGVRFRVDFASGHKTGFFCDQRDNRAQLAKLTRDADVLDVCCYTGGFGVYAKSIGEAREVTCVDLDEQAIAVAKKNANLNQARVSTVHADAFPYLRQMRQNDSTYDVVVLDPPKLVFGRSDDGEGRDKYFDLNALAVPLIRPGGILLTCSCSGGLPPEEFTRIVLQAVSRSGRECQILSQAGAAADHPVSPRCPESAYLKAIRLRIN